MSRAEILAYNAGVLAVLAVTEQAAARIARTSRRPIAEAFAAAALNELATTGRALLIPLDPPGTTALPVHEQAT